MSVSTRTTAFSLTNVCIDRSLFPERFNMASMERRRYLKPVRGRTQIMHGFRIVSQSKSMNVYRFLT